MAKISQSSDCFSDSVDMINSQSTLQPMDTDYESLVASTKLRLGINLRKEPQNASVINVLLGDTHICVNQSLCLITESLSESEVYHYKLSKYITDAVSLLQLLSDFIKMLMEVLSMKCCEMKTYPTGTGTIILEVFTHCKDSVSLYGRNLVPVEKELRELFNSCHELQLTYLMVLERHFEFNVTNVEEKDILLETLDINLKIGEIVQSLDAKPMAVQWKTYVSMCEKYCNVLTDMNTFENSMQVLCGMIKRNLETIFEDEDIKMVTRSLKIVSFFLKILQKVCDIFKQATSKNYEDLVSLLFCINRSRCFYLELSVESTQFVNLLLNPSDRLFKELLLDEAFVNSVLNYDIEKLKEKDMLVGFILTIASIMEFLTTGGKTVVTKPMVIYCLYKILPNCPSDCWNTDITLSQQPTKSHGLFDHLFTHAAALAFTFTNEEYCSLERHMFGAILDTDCASALFSANLWHVLSLARNTNPQLLFNQIVWLCTMFKKLEQRKMFHLSPQKIHLSYTISRLFDTLEDEDKLKVRKQFRIHDDDNVSLWTALGVRTLPKEAKTSVEEVVIEKLKAQFQCAMSSNDAEDVEKLTKLMSLAATCNFSNTTLMEHLVIKAWSKTCLKNQFSIQDVGADTVWFYNYLKALVQMTDSLWDKLSLDNGNLVRILHYVTVVIQQCSVEYKLLFIDILCKIAASQINRSKHVQENFTEAFRCLSQDSEAKNKLFITFKQYKYDKNMDTALASIENYAVYDIWTKITDEQDLYDGDEKLKVNARFTHKCFKSIEYTRVVSLNKQSSGSFYFADNVDFFENNGDVQEPQRKKVKLENTKVEVLVEKLESDVTLLWNMKDNVSIVEFRSRIENVCAKLRNIIN